MKGRVALNDLSYALTLFKVSRSGPMAPVAWSLEPPPRSRATWGAGLEQILRISEAELAGRCVSVQGRDEDALRRGADEAQDEPVYDRDPEAHREADRARQGETQ